MKQIEIIVSERWEEDLALRHRFSEHWVIRVDDKPQLILTIIAWLIRAIMEA